MNLLWIAILGAFLGLETVALLDSKDKLQPATHWIRRLLMLRDRWQPLYWVGVGFWLWLGVHFFVDS